MIIYSQLIRLLSRSDHKKLKYRRNWVVSITKWNSSVWSQRRIVTPARSTCFEVKEIILFNPGVVDAITVGGSFGFLSSFTFHSNSFGFSRLFPPSELLLSSRADNISFGFPLQVLLSSSHLFQDGIFVYLRFYTKLWSELQFMKPINYLINYRTGFFVVV